MPVAHILGFPRIGVRRELKMAVEAHWKGALSQPELEQTARELRARHWALQQQAGLDTVTVGDFAYYDHLHNVTALVSAAPRRFGLNAEVDLAGYFACNQAIHEAINRAAGNQHLTEMYELISNRVRRARYLANHSPERWAEAMCEHDAILDALKQRDGARCNALLRAHLEHKLYTIGAMEAEDASATGS